MVSTTQVGCGNAPNGLAAGKSKPKRNNKKQVGFKGDAKVESVLHMKVITSGSNQSGQIIVIVAALPSFIGDKDFPNWAESFRVMRTKTRDDFMPADVNRTTYGTVNQTGVFVWNGHAIETEDDYNRVMRV